MRLILSCLTLLVASVAPALGDQIGAKDPVLARVNPVVFCVQPYPDPDPDNPDRALWTVLSETAAVLPRDAGVPAVLGTAFGLEVQAAGTERLEDVTVVIKHPQLPDGATRHQWVASYPTERFGYSFFGFGQPEEVVPGVWEISLMKDDRVLYRFAFDVVAPDEAPDYMRFCE